MMLSLPWITQLLFIAMRLSSLILFSPIQVIRQLPVVTRLMLVFCFSFLLIGYAPAPTATDYLALRCLAEFTNGLVLNLCLFAFFCIYHAAGQLIDNQSGFNSIVFFNPHDSTQESFNATLLSMLALLLFFFSHGHLWLFKGLAYSFLVIPPGTLTLFDGLNPVIQLFGFMFGMSFILASPLIIILLSVDLSTTLFTKTMPQINPYFFSLPIKLILSLTLMASLLPYLSSFSDTMLSHNMQVWQGFMQ